MEKFAVIDTDKCTPTKCTVCMASEACPHKLLEQEAPDDPPVLWSTSECVGCGKCVEACPAKAVFIRHGSDVQIVS